MSIEEELKTLTSEINTLKTRLSAYEKSGFWTRRDVLKNIALGGLGIVGAAQLAKGDTILTDTAVSVSGTNLETITGSQAKVDTHAALDVAAGVHPNANTHLSAAAPHSGHLIITSGGYTANGTQNRDIAHGLGRTPQLVVIIRNDGGGSQYWAIWINGITQTTNDNAVGAYGIVSVDATNIRVGADGQGANMNYSNWTYKWIAIG